MRVIALDDSIRLDTFYSRPGSSRFEVYPAFDGRAGDVPPDFDLARFRTRAGTPPLPGEVGCAVSHSRLIREFAGEEGDTDDVMVVAEDDTLLTDDFPAVLDQVLARAPMLGIALLADSWGAPRGMPQNRRLAIPSISPHLSWVSTRVGGADRRSHRLAHYTGNAWGTRLYLITRGAARTYANFLCSQGGAVSWVADDYSRWAAPAGIDMKMVDPALALPAEWGESTIRAGKSTVKHKNNANRTWRERLRSSIAIRTRSRHFVGELRATARDLRDQIAPMRRS